VSERTVLITDYTWPTLNIETSILGAVGASLVVAEHGDEEELIRLAQRADAVLTCFAKVTAPVIGAGRRLRVIGRYGIGVDNIDVRAATDHGIVVTNVPAFCTHEVAEHTLALLFAFARRICVYDAAVRRGDWCWNR
jgi:D-3-phosphoglycerate dehydrogenase / 2-oxoglutarate reductase